MCVEGSQAFIFLSLVSLHHGNKTSLTYLNYLVIYVYAVNGGDLPSNIRCDLFACFKQRSHKNSPAYSSLNFAYFYVDHRVFLSLPERSKISAHIFCSRK